MKIIIVIPTYNERENVNALVPILSEEIEQIQNHTVEVLFVDDSSPDGTADLINDLSEVYPFVNLLLRTKKEGIGAAYIAAFKQAMELGADVIIEMDADFQHDPKDLKRLISAIDEGADYVIGSRYVSGGAIPKEWALYRKILSYGGSLFIKLVLGVFSVNDFTSGYKASRVKGFVDQINFDEVLSGGFAYKVDLLYKMHKLGAKIVEIPIVFGLRDRGNSKIETNTMFDFLKVIFRIRFNESKSFLKFIVVGFIGLGVDFGLANILRLTTLSPEYASATSGFVAMLTTYAFNNFWSFGHVKIHSLAKRISGFLIYIISSYMPIIFRSWLISVAILRFGNNFLTFNLAFFVGVVVGLIWNFTVYSKVVWKNKGIKSV